MEFCEYQRRLDALERERGWERVLPSHTFLHMGEEMGEIARILECLEGYRGTDRSREQLQLDLAGELADMMAFLFKLANQHDIDVGKAMEAHLLEFASRFRDIEQGRQEMARYVACQAEKLNWLTGQRD